MQEGWTDVTEARSGGANIPGGNVRSYPKSRLNSGQVIRSAYDPKRTFARLWIQDTVSRMRRNISLLKLDSVPPSTEILKKLGEFLANYEKSAQKL